MSVAKDNSAVCPRTVKKRERGRGRREEGNDHNSSSNDRRRFMLNERLAVFLNAQVHTSNVKSMAQLFLLYIIV